jgi:hypothetical protein
MVERVLFDEAHLVEQKEKFEATPIVSKMHTFNKNSFLLQNEKA